MVETRPERKVIVIPAREKTPEEQERKKNLRVAASCRVSTNKMCIRDRFDVSRKPYIRNPSSHNFYD